MLKNRISKLRIFSIIVLTLLSAFLLTVFLYFSDNAADQMPNVTQLNYNYASKSEPFKISSMQKLSERISLEKVSFCSELEETQVKEETVVPVLTNEYYFDIYGYAVNGSGITKDMVKKKEKAAVISDSLALKLFFNTDAVGKTITINDEVYIIRGVYKQKSGFINRISSDGKNRVYIPYTSYNGYEDCELNIIACDNSAMYAAIIEQTDSRLYYATDFSEKAQAVNCFKHILWFILYIALCVVALRIWHMLIKKQCSGIRKILKDSYFKPAVRAKPGKFILLVLTVVGIPAALLILFVFSDFSIYIVPKYIPDDNIFDLAHYADILIKNSNGMNSLSLTGDTYFLRLYLNTLHIVPWLMLLFLTVFFVWLFFVVSLLKKRENKLSPLSEIP